MRQTLPIVTLAAALALAGCANLQQNPQGQSAINPRVGTSTLGAAGTSGISNSPVSGSASNAASGSSILRQEGPAAGTLVPR